MSSAAIAIQAPRVALRTIFKVVFYRTNGRFITRQTGALRLAIYDTCDFWTRIHAGSFYMMKLGAATRCLWESMLEVIMWLNGYTVRALVEKNPTAASHPCLPDTIPPVKWHTTGTISYKITIIDHYIITNSFRQGMNAKINWKYFSINCYTFFLEVKGGGEMSNFLYSMVAFSSWLAIMK